MTRVFISHSHKDEDYALKLVNEMKHRGIEIWIDDRIEYGDEWPRVIQENLEHCPVIVVIMSTNSFRSKWVHKELAFAEQRGKLILPLLMEGENWLSLASTQYINVKGGKMPPETFFEKIRKHLGVKAAPPSPRLEAQPPSISAEEKRLHAHIVRMLQTTVGLKRLEKLVLGLFKVSYRTSGGQNAKFHMFVCEVGDEYLLSRYDPQTYTDYKTNLEALEKKTGATKKVIDPLTGRPPVDLLADVVGYRMPKSAIERPESGSCENLPWPANGRRNTGIRCAIDPDS
jgi:hypothetical protein